MKASNPIADMLQRQKAVNEIVAGNKWFDHEFDWRTAIIVEVGELIDSLDWKWWKHQSVDLDNAQIECIDIWHFVLSIIAESAIRQKISNDDIEHELEFLLKVVASGKPEFNSKSAIEHSIQLVSVVTECKSLNFYRAVGAAQKACEISFDLDMSIEDVAKLYFGKSVLNEFRQRHGYKEGSYKKTWHDREDNQVMLEFSKTLQYGPSYEEELNQLLEDMYLTVE